MALRCRGGELVVLFWLEMCEFVNLGVVYIEDFFEPIKLGSLMIVKGKIWPTCTYAK